MSPRSKREYVDAVHRRYKSASRSERTIILNELCATCGYNRKYAIRLLRGFKRFTKPKPRKRGKPAVYQKDDILVPLRRIWLEANLPCSKRLQAILPLWLPGYGQYFGQLSEEVTNALLSISPATIDRLLKPVRIQYKKRGRSTTKPGTLLRNQIPILTNQWNESRPGFLEADTVAHCGESLSGMFAYTIDTVDIATTWTEQRATWGKGETGVLKQIEDIEKALPFPLLGFDSDNGSEFLNRTLFKHFTKRKHPVQFTRSRAYHKDDNAHVEQKNWTHVRQWLGYQRLDNPLAVPLLNDLYRREWRVFHNFFCPSVKLLDKQRIGSKTIKRYDVPKTPCQRVVESPYIPQKTKDAMTKYLETLNPFLLKKALQEKLKKIFSLSSSG
jgi:hypothetical protein